jgi:hypothetical protein
MAANRNLKRAEAASQQQLQQQPRLAWTMKSMTTFWEVVQQVVDFLALYQ